MDRMDIKGQNDEKIKMLVEQIVESVSTIGYPGEIERLKDKYSKLKSVHQLQKSIVRQNMHNAMSPLSAISGYLELINMSLMTEPDIEQIDFYRKKIESGINEVNTIIEQLQGIYSDESDSTICSTSILIFSSF
jgi:homospermidine synthase